MCLGIFSGFLSQGILVIKNGTLRDSVYDIRTYLRRTMNSTATSLVVLRSFVLSFVFQQSALMLERGAAKMNQFWV